MMKKYILVISYLTVFFIMGCGLDSSIGNRTDVVKPNASGDLNSPKESSQIVDERVDLCLRKIKKMSRVSEREFLDVGFEISQRCEDVYFEDLEKVLFGLEG